MMHGRAHQQLVYETCCLLSKRSRKAYSLGPNSSFCGIARLGDQSSVVVAIKQLTQVHYPWSFSLYDFNGFSPRCSGSPNGFAWGWTQGTTWVTHVRRGGSSSDLIQHRYMDKGDMVLATTMTSWKVKPRGDVAVDEQVDTPCIVRR